MEPIAITIAKFINAAASEGETIDVYELVKEVARRHPGPSDEDIAGLIEKEARFRDVALLWWKK